MQSSEADIEQRPQLDVWDTHYMTAGKAFAQYRDALCSVYMPWTSKSDCAAEFHGRFETANVGSGTISRNRCSPMDCARGTSELARSQDECFYLIYVVSGFHGVEQNDNRMSAGPGEIVVADSSRPVRVVGGDAYDVIALTIPKSKLIGVHNLEDNLCKKTIAPNQFTMPLLSCTDLLSRRLTAMTRSELGSLYDACVALLPMAAGCFDDDNKERFSAGQHNQLLDAIKEFIGHSISDPDLSAVTAAECFGISVRYVHKLFAVTGTTFNAYVAGVRLDKIGIDLLAISERSQSISNLAYRWGFNDISTFNRSFKRRFGCSPSRWRHQRG
jgi:AraC-like DNA-binding protein